MSSLTIGKLLPGGGVAGAIHRAAGPGLAAECRPLAPVRPGQAVITGGHRLPNRHVIHCLGPVYGRDEPSDRLLASCYELALRLADEHRAASIAFPAISTGAFGYPMQAAAMVALGTIAAQAASLSALTLVRFVLHTRGDLTIHESMLAELIRRRFEPGG
ncbi:MAG TPA: macro domain-containing protein [Burkholderiales bacterium]|nr:macro domain-containing protein [Burkholderiales bacterium]